MPLVSLKHTSNGRVPYHILHQPFVIYFVLLCILSTLKQRLTVLLKYIYSVFSQDQIQIMHYLSQAGCKAIVSYLTGQWETTFGCNFVVNFFQCKFVAIEVSSYVTGNIVENCSNPLGTSLIFCDTNFRGEISRLL